VRNEGESIAEGEGVSVKLGWIRAVIAKLSPRSGGERQSAQRPASPILRTATARALQQARGGPGGTPWAPLAADQLRQVIAGPGGNPWNPFGTSKLH
jgi:hypothetical protein